MKKVMCDRCGCEIKDDYGISTAITAMLDAITNKPIYSIQKNGLNADLCNDCKRDLADWIAQGMK